MNSTRRLYGTADIGGTKIMVGLTDEKGRIRSQTSFPTLESSAADTMDRILNCIQLQCQALNIGRNALSGIGVVCAGPVDVQNGTVENPYTLPGWEHFPIVSVLSSGSGLPVKLENDVNGALLGEIFMKNLTEKRVLMVAFGTGIGAAFWADGRLYRAGGGYHPELGHIIVSSEGDACYCGQRGCFENLCSGTALHRRAKELGFLNFNDLYSEWKSGNKTAENLITAIQNELRTAFWNYGIIFKPDVALLGGGLISTYFPFVRDALMTGLSRGPAADNTGEENEYQVCSDFVPQFEILQANPTYNPALIGGMRLFY